MLRVLQEEGYTFVNKTSVQYSMRQHSPDMNDAFYYREDDEWQETSMSFGENPPRLIVIAGMYGSSLANHTRDELIMLGRSKGSSVETSRFVGTRLGERRR